MGTAELGLLVRLDSFIDNLNTHYKKLRDALAALKHRKAGIAEELARDDGYSEHIEMLVDRLAKIDKELGVKES